MSDIIIRGEKGTLRLRKSAKLVGLKMSQSRGLMEPDFIKEELHPNLGGFRLVKLDTTSRGANRSLDAVREREEVEVGTHVYYPEGSNKPLVPTGEIFITFEEGVSEEEQSIVLEEFHLELVERRSPEMIAVRVTPESMNPVKVAGILQDSCLVRIAEPDWDTILDEYDLTLPGDNLLSQQWHLQNNGFVPDASARLARGADARVVAAWKSLQSLGAANVTIAIIDNGFDLNHPDLRGKVVRPIDFWNNSPQVYQGDPRYTHGTPCASIALATSNGSGMVGVAPNARFMPVSGTSFSNRVTEQMFGYCVANGADIISCSWGTTDPINQLNSIKQEAIARAVREGRNGKGCVVLFAVGNDSLNYVNYYAAHPDVIAVSASNSVDRHAWYANQGMEVTVCAPSNGDWGSGEMPLIAARAFWDQGLQGQQGDYKFYYDGRNRGNNYKHFGGTSGATPLVAGICALMLSANPDLTAREVKEILVQTADKIGSPSEYIGGHSRKYGYGRVNAERAVNEALRRRGTSSPVNTIPGGNTPSTPSTGTSTTPSQPSTGSGNLFQVNVNEVPKSGWGVQAGAFSSQDNVIPMVNLIKTRFGQPAFVYSSVSNGRPIFKVIAGVFPTMQQAQALQVQMQKGGVNGFVKNLADL